MAEHVYDTGSRPRRGPTVATIGIVLIIAFVIALQIWRST